MVNLGQFRTMARRRVAGALAPVSSVAIVFGLANVFGLAILAGPTMQAQIYTTYPPGTGRLPQAGVTIKGDFVYGTAPYGGQGSGGVYEIKHLGDLYEFSGGDAGPEARVVFGPDSHLYGTLAGSNTGSVFNLLPRATICRTAQCQPWTARILYNFKGYPDGAVPGHGDLVWDPQGNIYGTTMIGGTEEYGVVYELTPPIPPSKTWTEKVLWSFTGPDGKYPQNGVIFDGNGNLYGTAKQGGANGVGTVFKLTPFGNGWIETNIYDFQNGNDGRSSIAGLMMDGLGNIYGATSDGGSGGGGTVFGLVPSGSSYTFKLLYSFSGQQGNNCGPWASLAMDAAGSLYGTTYCDGTNNQGSVFKLTNTQNGWVYTSVHDFVGGRDDGALPISNVSFDASGHLWGTASRGGGDNSNGVVWEITP